MRLRQWLLLALRTLAVVLLALALSRPVWHGGGSARHRGSSTVAILLDDSFSMEARLDPHALVPADLAAAGVTIPTRFAEARQRAREVGDLLAQGDRAVLVFAASPLRVPYESTVRDASLLTEEVERAATRPARADLPGALERIYPVLSGAKTLNREIFIISDFQKNQAEEWLRGASPPAAGKDTTAARGALPIPPDTRVYLIPVTATGTANLAVTGALYESDPAGAGGRLTARLRNAGEDPFNGTGVQVTTGDPSAGVLGEGYVDVGPGAGAQLVIPVPRAPGDGRLVVRSAPDLLERDNERYLVTTATSRFRILIVTGGALSDPGVRMKRATRSWRSTRGAASGCWRAGQRPIRPARKARRRRSSRSRPSPRPTSV